MNDKILYFKKLVGQNEVDTCLNELTVFVKADQPVFDEIIQIFARFTALQKQVVLGLTNFDDPEMNRIRNSLLSIIGKIKDIDFVENKQDEKIAPDEKLNKIKNVINSNFDSDIKNLEGDWKVDNIITRNTILIVTGVHFFPEVLDRVPAYYLQSIINEKGEFESGKRAIIVGDIPYELAKNMSIGSENVTLEDFSIISIGGPSVNRTTLDIINNKHKTNSNLGVNIAYEQGEKRVRVALWGNSAYKTMKSVADFIQLRNEGLDWLIHSLWNK